MRVDFFYENEDENVKSFKARNIKDLHLLIEDAIHEAESEGYIFDNELQLEAESSHELKYGTNSDPEKDTKLICRISGLSEKDMLAIRDVLG